MEPVATSASEVMLHLAGGVALMLWGVRMVRTGIMKAYGANLRRIIGQAVSNRFSALGAGIAITGLLQSSTATALIVSSFAGRGMIPLVPALALMLGADIGTTLVAQLLSFRITWLSPLLILCGLAAFLAGRTSRYRDLGRVGIGLGLILLALQLVVAASDPLRTSPIVGALIAGLAGEPVAALLIAAVLTALAHSSLAVVLLVMSMSLTGVVPVALGLALVLGANLGGAAPAVLATWGEGAAARRVPLGNLVFRLAGCLLAVPLLPLVAAWLPLLDADPGRQLVNFHTAFNLALAVLWIGFLDPVAALLVRLLPGASAGEAPSKPRYLDAKALSSPGLALELAARETLRMGDVVETMLRSSLDVMLSDDRRLCKEVEKIDDTVDELHEAIKLYLAKVSADSLDAAEQRRYQEIVNLSTNLEHIGDIVDKNLMELASKKIKKKLSFSPDGLDELVELHNRVIEHMRLAFSVFLSGDVKMARQLVAEKVAFRELERRAAANHLERLRLGRIQTIETSSLHLDVVRDLKRIHSHIASIAYPILEAAGELRPSRLRRAAAMPLLTRDPAGPAGGGSVSLT